MKLPLLVTTLLISAVLLAMPADSTVTYVDHEKVAKGGGLVTAPDLSVSVNRAARVLAKWKFTIKKPTRFIFWTVKPRL